MINRSGYSYSIKEAAKLGSLPESTLRYYETIGAAAVELTPHNLQEIDRAMAKVTVLGDRY